MLGRTHVAGGMISACASLLLFKQPAQSLPPPVALLALGMGMIGSLLPDIDHPQSAMGRQLPIVSDGVSLVMGHRGGMHSLLMTFLVGIAASIGLHFVYPSVAYLLAAALTLGYLSHLMLDALTPSGVPFLWPVNERQFSIPLAHTGGLLETCVVFPVLVGALVFLSFKNFPGYVTRLGCEEGLLGDFAKVWDFVVKVFWIFVEAFKHAHS